MRSRPQMVGLLMAMHAAALVAGGAVRRVEAEEALGYDETDRLARERRQRERAAANANETSPARSTDTRPARDPHPLDAQRLRLAEEKRWRRAHMRGGKPKDDTSDGQVSPGRTT